MAQFQKKPKCSDGSDAETSHLSNVKWIEDGMLEQHTSDLSASQKTLMAARAARRAGSKVIDVDGNPITPLLTQGRYLIPCLNIQIEFEFNNPRAVLQSADIGVNHEHGIEITKAELLLRRVLTHPTLAITYAKLLEGHKNALYPINRTDMGVFTISPRGTK